MYRTSRITSRINNAPVVSSQTDYDRDQIKREINSLRRNVHDLCTRSGTSFDCNKFLRSDDMSSVVTTIAPKKTITEYVGDKTLLVESAPLVRDVEKYGNCVV
ncbi:Mv-ORF125 peptide [Maruca vitrata nucleopolyhedrovirus]|uniref:Mv-ORF125 peptide n=1 Tax=Maruca vitrata nucleopolyhedrovirus TaxID=1307954 RepID=A1YRI7_9ABAC|nr:Mv-ORF125 peptide [Maruca vitrata nucleopolyhedrovirus]ABM05441.1 Mv-ORF125 peptide [Maruca vitrata nucleopolyhedrovirus]